MRLTLVRHGETEGQSSIRYHGRSDVPLSPLGRSQMERARAALNGRRFAGVFASRLSRAVEAAGIIGGTTAVTRIAAFDEIDFGSWEGLTVEEIQSRDPELYARWRANRAAFTYPGGESTTAFRARVATGLHEVLGTAAPGELLFVLHKGVIRTILGELLRLDDARRHGLIIALASIHVLRRRGACWHAEALDRTDHL
jgi:broad specificity phosphatase PhoE